MAELLPVFLLSLRRIHGKVKTHTHSYSQTVTLSMTTHLNGHVSDERFPMGEGSRKKEGRCDDEIQRLSPDRLGTRPLIALDVMWMTSQDTEHRFITWSSHIIHQQLNHWS